METVSVKAQIITVILSISLAAAPAAYATEITAEPDGYFYVLPEGESRVPEYYGQPYIAVNGGKAYFDEDDITTEPFELYSSLDGLGRCGEAYANICPELMPTGDRESISGIKPSGWHSVKYDSVPGKYLYNRCHLIAYRLAGENANEKNLITGTRYLNINGMLPFEDKVGDYVDETGNHVLYRVTPVFNGGDLVADGVYMEAYSVEDNGAGINFNVYCYNAQPGIYIDYETGESREDSVETGITVPRFPDSGIVIDMKSMVLHYYDCPEFSKVGEYDRAYVTGDGSDLDGYGTCPVCMEQN